MPATRSGGVPREAPLNYWRTREFPPTDALLASLQDTRLIAPPGTAYQYSNLGVAIMGTVVTSRFTAGMPAGVTGTARHSLGEAYSIAQATQNTALLNSAKDAFTHAASIAYIAGAVGVVAAAIVSFVVLRDVKALAVPAEGAEPEGALVPAEA